MNGNLAVAIVDSASSAVLASGIIDQFWGFAVGSNTWNAEENELTPTTAELPAGVPKVHAAKLSSVAIALQERALPPGADAAALAAAPPPESELPPLLPFSYVSPEAAETANMIELVVHELSPLPPHLQTVADTAAGKLHVSVGIGLPGGGPTVAVPLPLPVGAGGRVSLPALRRELLPPAAAKALQHQLEDQVPLVVEVARYVTAETHNDPAWEAYHACAPAPALVAQLVGAGATRGSALGLALGPMPAGSKGRLPPYAPPSGKSKPIEEAAPAGTCHWATAGGMVSVSVRLARPVVPPWRPPPQPPVPLLEMIPPRDLTPRPPPTTAADDFKAKVRSIALALAREYRSLLPAPPAGAPADPAARHKALVFELNRSGKYAAMRDSLKTSVVSLVREKYRKSGSMSPNEMALLYNDLYGTLLTAMHSALNDLIDAAAARPRAPPPEPVPDAAQLGQLLDLAGQAEAVGDAARAESLHQRRLLARNEPAVWYEFGTFCLRRGARGRAEQAFREALSLQPDHRPALLALLGCSASEGRATDPAYLEAAEAAAHRLMEVVSAGSGAGEQEDGPSEAEAVWEEGEEPGEAARWRREARALEPWAAMALVYKAFGEPKRGELASCEQEMARLERVALAAAGLPTGGSGGGAEGGEGAAATSAPALGELQARAFISLARTLLDRLALPSEALLALELAAGLRHWAGDAIGESTRSAHALASALAQQAAGGAEALLAPGGPVLALSRRGGSLGLRATLLAAELQRQAGDMEAAIRYYQDYLEAARAAGRLPSVPLSAWLQLAGCYTARGQPRYAADVYLGGAAAAPKCAVLWRGAGEALVEAGDLDGADMALSEANVLDPEDPGAWAWLALVSVRQGRQADAATALSFARRCGVEEPGVLLAVAEAYREAGLLREQQTVLQDLASRLMPESCSVRLMLARCLLAQRCLPEAAAALAEAREQAGNEDDEAAVAELEVQLREAGGHVVPPARGAPEAAPEY
ncbi:hypothetical protein GPECTOR_6g526 [Gonium pectorale]|uniref:Uncharacterized protein n=1 Tax=Gonium pectorale TaxID=33097 RepID=A0A150GUT9_GONPE|nr:hypothetical protein GPECTOR_6g526 [Gonium pectorale]|eukprot:KXZ53609.1 hypothetical protein GPECTOR_6g526 [Gonium pectorale]